jgi:hypothetical protein
MQDLRALFVVTTQFISTRYGGITGAFQGRLEKAYVSPGENASYKLQVKGVTLTGHKRQYYRDQQQKDKAKGRRD